MALAWRRAKCARGSIASREIVRGVAGAYCFAFRKVGWTSLAFNVVQTKQGTSLHLELVAPKTVMIYFVDDWAIAAACRYWPVFHE